MDRRIFIGNTQHMGKGLLTNTVIEKGTIVMKIPMQDFITFDKLMDFQDLTWIVDSGDCKITQFAFYLSYLHTFISSSGNYNFKPFVEQQIEYISNLPETYHNLICWSDQELQELGQPELVKKVKNKRQKIKNEYDKIIEYVSGQLSQDKDQERYYPIFKAPDQIANVKLETVLNFYSAIESRNVFYGSLYDPGSDMGALVPTLDFINHSFTPNCEVFILSDSFVVKTIKKIQENQQILVNYGKFSAERFLESYGFLPGLECIIDSNCQGDEYRKMLIDFYRRKKDNGEI